VLVRKSDYWYLVVANLKDGRFEVIGPFNDKQIIEQDALVHARFTRIQIHKIETLIGSVSNCNNKLSSIHTT
jgi:hypothetical protein